VCTSTLELGIDIGTVDQVVQYNSPRQVTSLIQRVGRSGHKLDRTSRGLVLAVSSDDAIESLAAIQAAQEGDLEPLHIHRLALDVLAHQIVGCALDYGGTAPWSEILKTIRSAEPYRTLEDAQADRVAEFLDHLGVLRQQGDKVRVTPKGRRYYFENLSTIRDERRYQVMDLTTQKQVGILGEEFMMIQAREGLHFIVRGRPWKIERIGKDGMVYVTPVADPNALIPGWDGEMLPVPFGLAQRVGRIRKEIDGRLEKSGVPKTVAHFEKAWPMNKTGARRLVEEHANHRKTGAPVPTDDRIVVEAFDRFLIVHASFGEVVNVTLGDLIELYLAQVSRRVGIKPSTVHYRKQLFVRIRKEWPGVDDLVPRKVSVKQAEEFAAALAKGLSPTRYNNSIDSLRAVFRIGMEEGLVSKNPFEGVGKLRPRVKQLKLPDTAAFSALLKIVRSKGAWCSRQVADLIEFLTYSGLRTYEAKMVQWSDIDFVRDTITVTGGDPDTKDDSATEDDRGTKNWSHRTLPLNDSLRRLLIDLRDNPRYFRNKGRTNYVLAVSECEKALSRACKEAGTPRITHHDLRHLFATQCIESGIDIPTLSRWLGHKDGGALVMKTYGHLRDDHSKEMAGKLKF